MCIMICIMYFADTSFMGKRYSCIFKPECAHIFTLQGCKFSDFCLISENFTLKYLKMFFEISSL